MKVTRHCLFLFRYSNIKFIHLMFVFLNASHNTVIFFYLKCPTLVFVLIFYSFYKLTIKCFSSCKYTTFYNEVDLS